MAGGEHRPRVPRPCPGRTGGLPLKGLAGSDQVPGRRSLRRGRSLAGIRIGRRRAANSGDPGRRSAHEQQDRQLAWLGRLANRCSIWMVPPVAGAWCVACRVCGAGWSPRWSLAHRPSMVLASLAGASVWAPDQVVYSLVVTPGFEWSILSLIPSNSALFSIRTPRGAQGRAGEIVHSPSPCHAALPPWHTNWRAFFRLFGGREASKRMFYCSKSEAWRAGRWPSPIASR